MGASKTPPAGEAVSGGAGNAATTRRSESLVPVALAGLLFFISGIPALVYQMAWQRILALHSGVGLYSVAMIVALFMAGLGIGSHLGGLLSRQLDERGALRWFGFIELGIGLFGAVSTPLYYDLLYLRTAWLYDATWSAGLGHFVLLVVPTCLMGMSLPILVRGMVSRVESAGRVIGYLYGVNVLGAAVGAAGCRPETERLFVFELCAPERRILERLGASAHLPQVRQLLEDPRMQLSIADGRNGLARRDDKYDVIEADASRSQSAYSGNLYSEEFFDLCASRLNRGGIMCTWSPTPRVHATFCRVFPYVMDVHNGEVLLESNDPLPVDFPAWEERLTSPAVVNYLGPHIASGFLQFLRTAKPADPAAHSQLESNRDLFPRDEFQTPGE